MNNFSGFSPMAKIFINFFIIHQRSDFIIHYSFLFYDAFAIGICAEFSIFSMKMPYPVVGSLIRTCVTAPTSLPFWMMGEPDTSVVK